MGDMSLSRKDTKHRKEECPGSVDIERGVSPTDGGGSTAETAQKQRILHRVPPQLRQRKKHLYEPSVVSLGPYHHSQPHLLPYEDFKAEVVNIILNSDRGAEDKGRFFRSKILERVDEIRCFYKGLSTKEYDDDALVEMMLRDSCLVLYHMQIRVPERNQKITEHAIQSIGALGLTSMADDFCRLENQIPWWIIKLLISLIYDDDQGEKLICQFLSYTTFWELNEVKKFPWKEGTDEEPLHLLEARRRTYLKDINTDADNLKANLTCPTFKCGWCRGKSSESSLSELLKSSFRSATELKAKGIYFRPSSDFLNDIRFSSHSFYGVLYLPVLRVYSESTAFFSNIVVLEMSPGSTSTSFPVTSYVNFLKSLIEKPKDVKMLQESGILISYLKDNEQIVKMFNEIDTHEVDNYDVFYDIRKGINEHCKSKGKTWVVELSDTYFRSPWSAIALFSATFLLCLTLLQTYYSVNPRK